ncbi:MAG: four helix bundle protein [Cytophagales bacterium]|nr:four helix bundle protein [Cytophagales bacterium]
MENNNEDDFGFRFRNWDIYKDAREFRKFVNALLKKYPKEEQFRLVDQTKRALNSIVLQISEGANRNTDKDTRVYINRSHTSLDEVVGAMDCALDDRYINNHEHREVLLRAKSLAKRLRKFGDYLLSSYSKS